MSELEQQKAGQRFSSQMRRNVDFTASSTLFLGGVICGRTTVEHEMNASIELEASQPFRRLALFYPLIAFYTSVLAAFLSSNVQTIAKPHGVLSVVDLGRKA